MFGAEDDLDRLRGEEGAATWRECREVENVPAVDFIDLRP
jgi:hypothetical protein